ncbi:hypothetical protein VNO78_01345 [Psophocarpus tetragonolobus]|uniref:Uncharacterized protein n=1 Tax=Psophocarpus tetragonolobus TaxID=3891 RepID=A0AAN9T0C3_PSOTE
MGRPCSSQHTTAIGHHCRYFNALRDVGRVEEAIQYYNGNYLDVISCYNEVLCINPLAADELINRGNTYGEIGLDISGGMNLIASIQATQLAHKHQQNKEQQQRIIVFHEKKMLELISRKLKKNSVALDIVNFGEEDEGKTEAGSTPHNC